jgi:hypothetical protein
MRKKRFDMLVDSANISIERIKKQLTNPDVEINGLKKLIEEIAFLNEKENLESENDLPATNTKRTWYEISVMTEVVLSLFAHELSAEAKKSNKIKDILK